MSKSLQLIPQEGEDPAGSFRALGKNFDLDAQVVQLLLKSHLKNFEEFRFFFSDEASVESFLAKIDLKDHQKVQVARLRRAWAALKAYYTQFEGDKSRVPESDLDTMLGESELRDAKTQFWIRYKLRFPPEVHPADSTLSRVSREMSKRMLCVFSVWKVKSLQFQLTSTQKKRKLGDYLFTEEPDEEEPSNRDAGAYLDKLFTLLLAYAMAGVHPPQPLAPGFDAKREATLGADTSKFAAVPLDVMMAYHYRAKRAMEAVSPGKRLGWLQARDLEERAEWTARFREGQATLGSVVKEVYVARDAHWLPPVGADTPPITPTKTPAPRSPPEPKGSASKFVLGKPINGRPVAKVMKDGTVLCQAFQSGNCKSKGQCPNGAHRCGNVTKKDRVCGASSHGAQACRSQARA